MSHQPVDVVEELIQAFNSGDMDAARSLIAPDVTHHAPGSASDPNHPPGTPLGRDDWLLMWQMTKSFIPDMRATLDEAIQSGDTVAARCTVRGTHTQDILGLAPTGQTFEMLMLEMSKVRDGQVVEHWAISDNITMMAQLGAEMPSWVRGEASR